MAVTSPPPTGQVPSEPPGRKPPGPPKTDYFAWWKRLPKWGKWTLAIAVVVVIGSIGSATGSNNKSIKTTSSQPAQTQPAQSTSTQTVAPETPLTVTNDGAIVHHSNVLLSGTSTRGATVTVDGTTVAVDRSGKWRKRVHLTMGDNTIDIAASAPNHTDASTSATLTREMSAAEKAAAARAEAQRKAAAARAEVQRKAAAAAAQSQENARRSAQGYVQMTGFSRQGLIDQLSSSAGEGYPLHDATVAVDSLNVNWNAQAVRSAKDYLHMSPFSCQGLIEQLSSSAGEGYTQEQAQYAAHKVGLC